VLPVAGLSDANCPSTIPGQNNSTSSANGLAASVTCPTGANATGYDVQSVNVYVGTSTVAGAHMKCSVYTYPGGYVAGTTPVPKVAPGCDSAEWSATITPNAYIPLAASGACHLAAATRYFLACNTDNGSILMGYTSGCTNCEQIKSPQAYATTPLPDPWTANNQAAGAMAFYLRVTPSP
jgi:hypothetical protein